MAEETGQISTKRATVDFTIPGVINVPFFSVDVESDSKDPMEFLRLAFNKFKRSVKAEISDLK